MPAKSEKQEKFMRAVAHSPSFAKKVGKTVVEKLLIWIGILAVGFVAGKGWIIKV